MLKISVETVKLKLLDQLSKGHVLLLLILLSTFKIRRKAILVIKISFRYFFHRSNLQKLNTLYICIYYTHTYIYSRKRVILCFVKKNCIWNTEFSNTNVKEVPSAWNSLNAFMAFDKPEPSISMGRYNMNNLKGSRKS